MGNTNLTAAISLISCGYLPVLVLCEMNLTHTSLPYPNSDSFKFCFGKNKTKHWLNNIFFFFLHKTRIWDLEKLVTKINIIYCLSMFFSFLPGYISKKNTFTSIRIEPISLNIYIKICPSIILSECMLTQTPNKGYVVLLPDTQYMIHTETLLAECIERVNEWIK